MKQKPPLKSQTLYACYPRPGLTNRMRVLRVNIKSVRIQYLHDDGSPIKDGDCGFPATNFIITMSFDEWHRIRKYWRLKP